VTIVIALTVAVLYATGTYLLLQRSVGRIALGVFLLGHACNLLLLSSGRGGSPPFAGATAPADPLPMAAALTAIVITLGTSSLLLALSQRAFLERDDDEVRDDLEDRRIARGEVEE
jgi:multicomponent Na+:H+ antiporter subunit C